jgi:tetratricopeptide (TPR) repeat protein
MDVEAKKPLEYGQELYLAGNYKEAIAFAKKHLKTHPNDLEMLRLLSACYYNSKNTKGAIETTEKIITIEPRQAEDLFNLCHLYCLLKQYEKAEEICLKGLALSPNHSLGLKNLASAYLGLNKKNEAKETFDLFISTFPQHATPEDFLNLANLLSQSKELTRIVQLILMALKKEPHHVAALSYLISAAMKHNEHYLVVQAIEKLLTIDREQFTKEAALNFATALFDMGYINESISMFEYTLQLYEDIRMRASYGMVLLSAGKFEKGWHEYLARIDLSEVGYEKHKFEGKLWRGENLNKKTLLIAHEQGLGDTIQFVRYIALLKKKYKVKIIFKSPVALENLMKQIPDIDSIFTKDDPTPKHDYHIPILSLPYYLHIFSNEQFLPEPYLNADKELINRWQSLISSPAKLKIGFCWGGSKTHAHNARRNCQLNHFLFLCTYAQVLPVSLQKELTSDEKATLQQYNIVDAGSAVNDLADTAALIAQLDLIISIDTSIAHLAGAMGKTVWLLLPFQTEWRHPRGIAKSPWYKDVSFMRQPTIGDWASVFKQVERDLQAYMQLNL